MKITFHHRGRCVTVYHESSRTGASGTRAGIPLWDLFFSCEILPLAVLDRARDLARSGGLLGKCPFRLFVNGRPVPILLLSSGKKHDFFDAVPYDWLHRTLPQEASYNHIDVRVRVSGGLRGGKGGFGAQLKALGKAGAAKKTRNFGACRDLNGRRLRHVNDALRLKLWRESRRESSSSSKSSNMQKTAPSSEGDTTALPTSFSYRDGQTMSGISGWHLTTPSWADGVKTGKLLSQHKREFYTAKRSAEKVHEQQARRKRAHDELVNEYASLAHSQDIYHDDGVDSIMSAVSAGLKKEEMDKKRQDQQSKSLATNYAIDPVLSCLRGSVGLGSAGEAMGEGNFGSVGVAWAQLKSSCWFYEVELMSEGGIIQIGWASTRFLGNDESGDGIGDDVHSWSYDGHRGMRWHGGDDISDQERSYGGELRTKKGDVIGSMFDFEKGCISYWVNGSALGVAFNIGQDSELFMQTVVYPAASLDAGQSIRFNLGQMPFQFPPTLMQQTQQSSAQQSETSCSIAHSSWRPVWDARPRLETHVSNEDVDKKIPKQVKSSDNDSKLDKSSRGTREIAVKTKRQSSTSSVKNRASATPELLELEALGMDALKSMLKGLGAKCGGTLRERAERMLALKGLTPGEIPKIHRAPKRRKRQRKNNDDSKNSSS